MKKRFDTLLFTIPPASIKPGHADACWLKETKTIPRLDSNLVISHGTKAREMAKAEQAKAAADGTKARSDMIIQMDPGNGSTSRRSCHRIPEANPYLEKDHDKAEKKVDDYLGIIESREKEKKDVKS